MKFSVFFKQFVFVISFLLLLAPSNKAQTGECPYPVIFVHGWISSDVYWSPFYDDNDYQNVWGSLTPPSSASTFSPHVFYAMPNAEDTHEYDFWGNVTQRNDDINGTNGSFDDNGSSDDVQWIFPNHSNVLASGCSYAINFNNRKTLSGDLERNPLVLYSAPCLNCSDNNEAAVVKQGYALKGAIQAVLDANPDKDKVILVGHSMGGLCSREYLQRTDASGNPRWWLDPTSADGHKVAKLVSVGTPHLGSNTGGNISDLRPDGHLETEEQEDSELRNELPDLLSEAVRDLRYSYDRFPQADYPGPYLFGGSENAIPVAPSPYHSNDVNCDGDENDQIIGINVDGTTSIGGNHTFAWYGSFDNPMMPLPLNVRYTWYVSNVVLGGGGDGVVFDDRQWLYLNGNGSTANYNDGSSIPAPSDGTPYRLSDRITSPFPISHTNQMADVDNIVRGLDEGDYPEFAWSIKTNINYAGMAQTPADKIPADGNRANNQDPDWYVFELDAPSNGIEISVLPTKDLSGQIDFYEAPTAYETMNSINTLNFTAATNPSMKTLKLIGCFEANTPYYVRLRHDQVNTNDWKNPFTIQIDPLPVTIPSDIGLYTATNKTQDGTGWTHYWKEASANPVSANDLLLLSIQEDAYSGISTPAEVQVEVTASGVADLSTAAYVNPASTWFVMHRYWEVNPTTQPGSPLDVRFYYTDAEYNTLKSMANANGASIGTNADLQAYKFSSGSNVNLNPLSGHLGGNFGNFIQLPHVYSVCDTEHYAEFTVNGFSGGGLGAGTEGALPVDLIKFEGTAQKEHILLNWSSASEINSTYFSIQKLIDKNYKEIGNVPTQGANFDYSFADNNPIAGPNYYRLQIFDEDGSAKYSQLIVVYFKELEGFSLEGLYPNPVKEQLQIVFYSPTEAPVFYRLYNAIGQLVFKTEQKVGEGLQQFKIDMTAYPAGIYLFNMEQSGKNYTQTIVK